MLDYINVAVTYNRSNWGTNQGTSKPERHCYFSLRKQRNVLRDSLLQRHNRRWLDVSQRDSSRGIRGKPARLVGSSNLGQCDCTRIRYSTGRKEPLLCSAQFRLWLAARTHRADPDDQAPADMSQRVPHPRPSVALLLLQENASLMVGRCYQSTRPTQWFIIAKVHSASLLIASSFQVESQFI